jgi:hypothetical protein
VQARKRKQAGDRPPVGTFHQGRALNSYFNVCWLLNVRPLLNFYFNAPGALIFYFNVPRALNFYFNAQSSLK